MKNKLIAAAVIVPAMFMASSAFAAQGETATINFTGKIVQDTCTLDTTSKSLSVPLGDVTVSAFSGGAGATSLETPFKIGLVKCDPSVAKNATVTFNGQLAGSDTNVLTTDAIDKTNVGIQILEKGAPLTVDGSAASAPLTLEEGDGNAFNFAARYVSIGEVAPGNANGTVNFTVNYN
ncbi:fimbrial protein [Enterobacter cancerogenus]